MIYFAHRGIWDKKSENTIEALSRALELGAAGVEVDVRQTKDGVLVLHHNPKVRGKSVQKTSYDELKTVKPDLARLEEMLQMFATRCTFDVEIKSRGFEYEVLELAKNHVPSERFVITSFNYKILETIKRLDPRVRTGLIYGKKHVPRVVVSRLSRATAADFFVAHSLVWKAAKKKLLGTNKPVWVWGISQKQSQSKAFDKAVALIVDYA